MDGAAAVYVLDQNFPIQILNALWPTHLEVRGLADVDPLLTRDVQDWEITLELHHAGFQGFITNDARILRLPEEMVALQQTQMTQVVTAGTGHNALQAEGLLLVHLVAIVADTAARPLAYTLRQSGRSSGVPGSYLQNIAESQGTNIRRLRQEKSREMQEQLGSTRPHLLYLMDRPGRRGGEA